VNVIREFDFRIPLLVTSDNRIIDGHLRVKAAVVMGMSEVPVIVCDDWTEAQIKAFRLTANRSATWATWDLQALAEELSELDGLNFDLALTGFDRREIDELLAGNWDATATDSTPEPPLEPVSEAGDMWRLDGHRVLCGDATSATDVDRLCAADIPVLMNTDPPYGVTYDPLWRQQAGLGQQRQTGKVRNDDRSDWAEAFALFRGDVIYTWHAALYAAVVARGLEACGFKIYSQIIWMKQHFALSRAHYHWRHEPCWYAVREGRSSHWCGDRKQSTVWEVSNLNPFGGDSDEGTVDESTGHGTQKPVELMRRPIINHTQPGDIVYDPFLGSGSVLIAAETTGRVCYGLEIDPAYVDVVVHRWQKLSGKQAVLDGDGRTFAEVAAQRRAQRKSATDVAVESVEPNSKLLMHLNTNVISNTEGINV
jgi:DNA modification methylase